VFILIRKIDLYIRDRTTRALADCVHHPEVELSVIFVHRVEVAPRIDEPRSEQRTRRTTESLRAMMPWGTICPGAGEPSCWESGVAVDRHGKEK